MRFMLMLKLTVNGGTDPLYSPQLHAARRERSPLPDDKVRYGTFEECFIFNLKLQSCSFKSVYQMKELVYIWGVRGTNVFIKV